MSSPASHSIAIIILSYNEEIHIARCIQCAQKITDKIVVVDSYSTDNTTNIATELGVTLLQNPFVNQAQQFQWAVDHCGIESDWILRLDADEFVDDELVFSIKDFVAEDGNGYNGAIFNRKHIFLGKWIRHGGRYPLPILRLFRQGCAHIEQRWMDEHIVLDKGASTTLKGGFFDDNLNSISWFIEKHSHYASREMLDIMLQRLHSVSCAGPESTTTGWRRFLKQRIYLNLPYFIRPFLYFCFRYFIQLGFLDGARGFAYHFMQGFWYRALVDLKCLEAEMQWECCVNEREKLTVLENLSGYKLD